MFLQKFNKSGLLGKKMSMNKPKMTLFYKCVLKLTFPLMEHYFILNSILNYQFSPPHHISSLSVVLWCIAEHSFLQAQLVDKKPILARPIP
jgi:hypothetical protein